MTTLSIPLAASFLSPNPPRPPKPSCLLPLRRRSTPLASSTSFLPIPSWRTHEVLPRPSGFGREPPFKIPLSTSPLPLDSSYQNPRWVTSNSLHSSPFPLGSDPNEPENTFPVTFSHLGSPLLLDPVADSNSTAWVLKFPWIGYGVSLDFPTEAVKEPSLFHSSNFPVVERPELDSIKEDRKKYNALRRRQVKVETEAWERAAEEYKELEREMLEKKLAPSLPYVKSLFLGWFEPLRDAIEKEQRFQRGKRQKAAYAYHINLLPADKMSVIVMHKMMGLMMMGQQEGCVRVVQAAIHIGEAVEWEVKINDFLVKTKRSGRGNIQGDKNVISSKEQLLRKRLMNSIKRKKLNEVQKLLKNENEVEPWGRDAQAKLGSRLIELLIESAFVQPPLDQVANGPPEIRPAFRHTLKTASKENGKLKNKFGVIECDPLVHKGLDTTAKHMLIPYLPMLIPPKNWRGYDKGGYLYLPSYVMRTHGSKEQQYAIRGVPRKQLQKVFEALDTLGSTKWRVNRRVLDVIESVWSKGGDIAGLVDRADIPIPERPDSDELTEVKEWRWSIRKAKKANSEMHAQRCDIELKLSVARKMRDEEGFYYPHNLDFRGRAYPMHSYLNHLSSDLCRGILEFAEGKPLGRSGLHWLKIHLANIYGGGVEKLGYDGRLAFVENHLHDIFDSAMHPVDGKRWWINAEDPFQCLAACINLHDALRSSSPHSVISHLPIHQDGSCNGLQHYAALGRDSLEAAAVNLVAGEKPADVYSGIAARVLDIMRKDSQKDPTTDPSALLAKVLVDQVDRKLVKQTVMTSVYGVTYVGAREQIKRRLQEKGQITDDRLLFSASCYAAKVTLNALGEMFQAARGIMKWLGDCAKVIALENQPVRWTTPLGLPVVQPYRKSERHLVSLLVS